MARDGLPEASNTSSYREKSASGHRSLCREPRRAEPALLGEEGPGVTLSVPYGPDCKPGQSDALVWAKDPSYSEKTLKYGRERLEGNEEMPKHPGSSDGKEFACDARELGSIPGLERPPWRKSAAHSVSFPAEIREPGELQFMGLQESDMTEHNRLNFPKVKNLDNCIVVSYQVSNFTLNANVHSMSGTFFKLKPYLLPVFLST